MPELHIGDRVRLRSGRFGKIMKIVTKNEMAMDADYKVLMDKTRTEPSLSIVVTGLNVRLARVPHLEKQVDFNFTDQESTILDQYTGPKFKAWNSALRTSTVAGDMLASITAMKSVITKIKPKFAGKVYRGLLFSTEESANSFLKFIEKGKAYTTPQFFSTSQSTSAAYTFAGGAHGVFITVICAGKQGARLRQVTGNNDMGENEILFPPGANFKVHDCTKTKVGEVKYMITMLEDGASPPLDIFQQMLADKEKNAAASKPEKKK